MIDLMTDNYLIDLDRAIRTLMKAEQEIERLRLGKDADVKRKATFAAWMGAFEEVNRLYIESMFGE